MGYIKPPIPNVEFFTATVFIAGFAVGPLFGALTGALAEFTYSFFNPLGAPLPPTLLAQIMCMAVVGYTGGLWRKRRWQYASQKVSIILTGLAGFLLTLLFDVVTTLSFVLFAAGLDMAKIAANFAFGMGFYLIHLCANTIIFFTIVPLVIFRLQSELK